MRNSSDKTLKIRWKWMNSLSMKLKKEVNIKELLMNIGIFSRQINEISYMQQLMKSLKERGISCWMFKPLWEQVKDRIPIENLSGTFTLDDSVPLDFLLSLGGDGTLLNALPIVQKNHTPVLGINLGNLGFLTSIGKERITLLADDLLLKKYTLEERTLISFSSSTSCFDHVYPFAMNEISIHRKEDFSLLGIDVFVDDVFVAHYYGDGVIVATPTGSTAYSLSCGGPILAPDSSCFVITPIAAHTLTLRPIIVHDQSVIRLVLKQIKKDCYISMDSQRLSVEEPCEIELKKASFSVKLVRMQGDSFYHSIRNKLMWGGIYKQ